jgi:hypothetical protein
MAQAERTTITRRAVVAAAAGVPVAAAASLPASAFAAAPDQKTLAAIAAHRAAYEALDAACLALSALERRIPEALRQGQFDDEIGTGAGANDDPRWTAGNKAYQAAAEAETAAAWALAHLKPTTLAGAVALLRYAAESAARGEWPDLPETEEDDADWYDTFHASLAGALAALG